MTIINGLIYFMDQIPYKKINVNFKIKLNEKSYHSNQENDNFQKKNCFNATTIIIQSCDRNYKKKVARTCRQHRDN